MALAAMFLGGCTGTRTASTPPATNVGSQGTIVGQSRVGFVGTWYVHDGQLTIDADHTGEETDLGGCATPCVEHDVLAWRLTDGGRRLVAEVRGVSFTSRSDGAPVAGPGSSDQAEVGDSFSLRFVAPHLLRSTLIHLPVADGGNPYWCGAGLDPSLQPRCGA